MRKMRAEKENDQTSTGVGLAMSKLV